MSKVNHPAHYGGADNPYEAIKVIEAWGLDKSFCLGNAVKYIARAGKKADCDLIEDLEKAAWYIAREIERLGAARVNLKQGAAEAESHPPRRSPPRGRSRLPRL